MNTLSLFKMPFSEFQLKDTVSMALQQSVKSPLLDKFSIENSLKTSIRNHIENQLKSISFDGGCPTCPPGIGLRTKFMATLQVQIDYKVSFKAGLHAGLEFGNSWSSFNSSAHLSLYNSGLGTPIYDNDKEKRKMVIDATIALNVMVGSERGNGIAMNQYLTNYDTPMPVQNTFSDWSVGYGQALTWNSAVNKKFDLKDIQRQGIVNLRVGNFALSTNNDTAKIPYFGGGSDYSWTGGIIISFPVANFGIIEMGYQNFTGKYDEKGFQERQMDSLRELNKKGVISKNKFKQESKELLSKFPHHTQDDFQKDFNRASNFIRIRKDMNFIRLDIESNGWFQNLIHSNIQDFKFKYDNRKPIGIWIERAF